MNYLKLSVIILFASSAFSQTEQNNVLETTNEQTALNMKQASFSEALYQPQSGVSTFTFAPIIETTKSEYKFLSNQSLKQVENKESSYLLAFERGFLDSDLALKIQTSAGTDTKKTTQNSVERSVKFTGFSDFMIHLKYLNHLSESLNLSSGAEIGYSPEKAKQANSKIDGNRLSGGNSISPFLAVEKKIDLGSIGAKLIYKINGARTSVFESQNYTSELTGGNETKAMIFGELNMTQKNKLGVTLTYREIASSTLSENDDGAKDTFDLDGYKSYTSGVYARINVASNYSLVPQLTYSAIQTEIINNLKYNKNETVSLSMSLNAYF